MMGPILKLIVKCKTALITIFVLMPFWYLIFFLFSSHIIVGNGFFVPTILCFSLSVCWYVVFAIYSSLAGVILSRMDVRYKKIIEFCSAPRFSSVFVLALLISIMFFVGGNGVVVPLRWIVAMMFGLSVVWGVGFFIFPLVFEFGEKWIKKKIEN